MEEQGYTIIERAISPVFADAVREATLRALLPHQTFSMNWISISHSGSKRIHFVNSVQYH